MPTLGNSAINYLISYCNGEMMAMVEAGIKAKIIF